MQTLNQKIEDKMERLKAEIEIDTLQGDSIAKDLINAMHLNNFVGDYLFIPPSILRIIVFFLLVCLQIFLYEGMRFGWPLYTCPIDLFSSYGTQ